MEKFRTVLSIVKQQSSFYSGLVALLTAGGEQIFSTVAFRCPCNDLNFFYGLVFLFVPALALLLLGFTLSKRTWKLVTGLCHRKAKLCRWRNFVGTLIALFHVCTTALVAPSSWMAVALLSGNYFECAMSGANMSAYNVHVCGKELYGQQCYEKLLSLPCARNLDSEEEKFLRTLRAHSQIVGWLLISAIMLFYLTAICFARCMSPISYEQLKFWRSYTDEENNMMETYTSKHARELAERNLKSFFQKSPPQDITSPSNEDWESISALYRFRAKNQFYSTLHRHVEDHEPGIGLRTSSVKSSGSTDAPGVLGFVDGGLMER